MPVCSADKTNFTNRFIGNVGKVMGAEPWHHRMKDYLIDKLHISGNEEGFSDANASAHLKRIKDMLSGPNGTTFWPEPECLNHSLGFKRKGKLLQFKFDSLKSGSLTENTVHNSNKSSYDLVPINLSDMRFSALFEESEAIINSMKIEDFGLRGVFRVARKETQIPDIRRNAKYNNKDVTPIDKGVILKRIFRELELNLDLDFITWKSHNVLEKFTEELVKVPVGKLNIFFSLSYIFYFIYKVHNKSFLPPEFRWRPEALLPMLTPNILSYDSDVKNLTIYSELEAMSPGGEEEIYMIPGKKNFLKKLVTDVPRIFELVAVGVPGLKLSLGIATKQREYEEWKKALLVKESEEDEALKLKLGSNTIEKIGVILEANKTSLFLSGAVERYKLNTRLNEILSNPVNHDYQYVKRTLTEEFGVNVFERNEDNEKLKPLQDLALDTKLDEILSVSAVTPKYYTVKRTLINEFGETVFNRNKNKIQKKMDRPADTAPPPPPPPPPPPHTPT
jgi:hypothetical protein